MIIEIRPEFVGHEEYKIVEKITGFDFEFGNKSVTVHVEFDHEYDVEASIPHSLPKKVDRAKTMFVVCDLIKHTLEKDRNTIIDSELIEQGICF